MMEAQELRIGNIIEGYLEPQVSEWVEIEVTLEVLGRMQTYPNTHGYRPISLTGEWLVRLGFEKLQKGFMYDRMYLITTPVGFLYKNDLIDDFVRINFVHNLQNLYHALTGQELTLKTNP